MLNKEIVLCWNEIEHDLYEENGHIFGVELDLFNNHKYFYCRKGNICVDLSNVKEDDIYEAIEKFNDIVAKEQ